MSEDEFKELTEILRAFAEERKWEKFHTPKNLAMAISAEVGELVAEFRWLDGEESRRDKLPQEKLEAIEMEIADVQILLLQLADKLSLEIPSAVRRKIEINKGRHWETDKN